MSDNVSHETGTYPNGNPWTCELGHPLYSDGNHASADMLAKHPDVSHETLEQRIERYRQAIDGRNQLVKDLLAAGWRKREIARRMKIGRPTIDRILGAAYAYNHGTQQRHLPRPKE